MTKNLLRTISEICDTHEAGQRIFARIRKSSKYYGQGGEGKLFAAVITHGEYAVAGNENQYRLVDVDVFAEFLGQKTQITFGKK